MSGTVKDAVRPASVTVLAVVMLCSGVLATSAGILTSGRVPDPTWSGSAMQVWYKADAGVQTNASGRVTNWVDQATFSRDLTEATAGSGPDWFGSGMGSNDLPRVHLVNARDDRLSDAFTLNYPYTLFVVFNGDDVAGTGDVLQRMIDGAIPTGNRGAVLHFRKSGISENLSLRLYSGDGLSLQGPDTTPGTAQVAMCIFNEANSSVSLDGDTATTGALGNDLPGGITLGGWGSSASSTYLFKGDISEVIVYSGILGEDDAGMVGRYLSEKYGITTMFPDFPPKGTCISIH